MRFSNEDASDCTQETLLRLVRKVEEGAFDSRRGKLQQLAFGIAHFVALETAGTPKILSDEGALEKIPGATEIEEILLRQERAQMLRRSLRQLSNDEEQIVSLLVDQELTIAEISVIVAQPEGTVKSHIHRAKQKMKRIFERGIFYER